MRKTQYSLFILFIAFASCKDQEYSQYLVCNDIINTTTSSSTAKWQRQIIENDSVIVEALFDTLRFDKENVINTISHTWLIKPKYQIDNWKSFVKNEQLTLSKEMSILKSGITQEYNWILAKQENVFSYLRYINSEPKEIIILTTSDSLNQIQDFCNLLSLMNLNTPLKGQ